MTESELLASPDFLAWCRVWEEERRCPAPFADWCGDRDFWQGYEACVWAHEKEERAHFDRPQEYGRPCPRRMEAGDGSQMFWKVWNLLGKHEESEEFPVPTDKWFDSFSAAIAYIVLNFDRELAAKYPPKVREAVPA